MIEKQISVTAGTTSDPVYLQNTSVTTISSWAVRLIPGVGGSMTCETSTSPANLIRSGTGTVTWETWDQGTVTTTTTDRLLARVTAIRFTATTEDGLAEVTG